MDKQPKIDGLFPGRKRTAKDIASTAKRVASGPPETTSTPTETEVTQPLLPAEYKSLIDFFRALHVVIPVMRARRELPFWDNLIKPIEMITKRYVYRNHA